MTAESLTRVGADVLRTAASRSGDRDRDVAFELLAADGLLTLACERAALEDEPEAALESVLRALVEEID